MEHKGADVARASMMYDEVDEGHGSSSAHIIGSVGHAFISYARADKAYVEEFAGHLRILGVDVWFDDDIPSGLRWSTVLEEKIQTCDVVIVVMTPAARASAMVENEIDLALSLDKPLALLLLAGDPFFGLRHLQYTDVRAGNLPGGDFVAILPESTLAGSAGSGASRPLSGLRPSGRVVAWGPGGVNADMPPNLPEAVAVAAGGGHSVILHGDGQITAWGNNNCGQTRVPTGIRDAIAISAGQFHTLALHRDGHVSAWGLNDRGQVNVPTGLTDATAIAAGTFHSLVLHRGGHVSAFGDNPSGQTAVPAGLSDVVAVAGGHAHSLALHRDGSVTSWGYVYGKGPKRRINDAVAIAAGVWHSLALHRDGRVSAWGLDEDGQIAVPTGINDAVAIAAGAYHNLVLHRDGHMTAWGKNNFGQARIPVGLTGAIAIATGHTHNLAIVRGRNLAIIRA